MKADDDNIFKQGDSPELQKTGTPHVVKGHDQNENDDTHEFKYQCPMHCEGSKTYDQPGNCPVCNMKLVLVH